MRDWFPPPAARLQLFRSFNCKMIPLCSGSQVVLLYCVVDDDNRIACIYLHELNHFHPVMIKVTVAGIVFLCSLLPMSLYAQVYTNKVLKKNEPSPDSLKKIEYPYMLPIWGEKAARAGFTLPYSAGVSLNYLWQQSDIVIDNLMVGFNNGPMYSLDGLVRFNKAQATAQAVTIRPDFWLFPFLDIYGILGRSMASTDVGFGVYIPDSTNNEQEIFSTGSKVNFNATTAGFGITPTIGVGGGWLALDMNMTWTDVPQLNKPAFAFIFGPRAGKTFKLKNPDQNVAVWAGGFRVKLNSGTNGSVNLGDVLPTDQLEAKISQGQTSVANAQQEVNAWWNNLTPPQQSNPINKAKYDAANAVLYRAGQVLDAAAEAVTNISISTVQYSMDKRPKDMWNFIVGSQFQFNRHFMFRVEAGFLSSRVQALASLQYRFGL